MLVKELISLLKTFPQNKTVTLDTFEGISLLDISQVTEDKKGIVLYGSVMELGQSRGDSKIPPEAIFAIREAFYPTNRPLLDHQNSAIRSLHDLSNLSRLHKIANENED